MSTPLGTITVPDPGYWLIVTQSSLSLTGTPITDTSAGLPYLIMYGGANSSFVILPTNPDVIVPWCWSFVYQATEVDEVVFAEFEVANLDAMVLNITLSMHAYFLGLADDDSHPDAATVRVNPGSKLQILRQANR